MTEVIRVISVYMLLVCGSYSIVDFAVKKVVPKWRGSPGYFGLQLLPISAIMALSFSGNLVVY